MITLAGKVLVRKALMGAIIDDAIDAEALTNALNTIQEQCGLDKFPRTKPPLILLDNLECSRSNLYEELLQNMKIQVEFAIDGLEEKDIIDMLRETIKFIVVKELQSIPILLINKLKTIPTKILHILHSKGILDDMPLNIQQSAWKADRQLFRTKLHTTLSSSKSLNDMLIATVNLIGKEGGLLTELCMFACDALTSSNNNSTISGGNSFVGVNFSLLMRRIFNHLQANSARVPSLGKLFDLAAYIELLCSKKSKESKENACEEDIYEALQQIIHSEMSIRDKDIAATMHRTHGGDVIPAVKTSQRDYESAWQFINKLDVGGVFAHPVPFTTFLYIYDANFRHVWMYRYQKTWHQGIIALLKLQWIWVQLSGRSQSIGISPRWMLMCGLCSAIVKILTDQDRMQRCPISC